VQILGNKQRNSLICRAFFHTPAKKLLARGSGPILVAMPKPVPERRSTPRRRLRDQLASRPGTLSGALAGRPDLQNHLLLVDDDLRETALALGGIERFLAHALSLIEKPDLTREELAVLAGDDGVLDQIDTLSENLANLRRRMVQIASSLG
jgi:hypothetical protein